MKKNKIIPKQGQSFNAIDKSTGRIVRGCPCKCTKVYDAYVAAIDQNKDKRIFKTTSFDFEIVK